MLFWHFLRPPFVTSAKTAFVTTRGDDRVNDDCGFHSMNLWYTKVKVKDASIISFVSKEQLSRKVTDYILLVPYDPNLTNEITEYTIISKNILNVFSST